MGVILIVCVVFGLTVSEAKAVIMCSRVKRIPESTATDVQPDERACIPRGERQSQ